MTNVIGLDVGRSGVKAYAGTSMFTFPSVVGEGRERNLHTEYSNGFEVQFNGDHYFVGELAQHESDFARSMMTDNKAHGDTLILALVAIHRAGLTDATVVTGLPVFQHNAEHKEALRRLLIGQRAGVWDITINGHRRMLRITDVKVAVEGGGAFWAEPQDGLVRIIDAGSKTINFVTMRDRRYNNRDSGTLDFGFGTTNTDNPQQMARRIAGELGRKWKAEETVLVCGGRAKELASLLVEGGFFPNARPLNNPLFANAIGFYHAGRRS